MTNTNWGVSFVIVDSDSYRYINEDPSLTPEERLSPLRDLPAGVRFVQRGKSASVRFRRLGDYCYPAVAPDGNCATAAVGTGPPPSAVCTANDATRCTTGAGLNYIDNALLPADGGVAGGLVVQLQEIQSNLIARVQFAPGGRVSPDYRQAR
jgi:hypothetical protein